MNDSLDHVSRYSCVLISDPRASTISISVLKTAIICRHLTQKITFPQSSLAKPEHPFWTCSDLLIHFGLVLNVRPYWKYTLRITRAILRVGTEGNVHRFQMVTSFVIATQDSKVPPARVSGSRFLPVSSSTASHWYYIHISENKCRTENKKSFFFFAFQRSQVLTVSISPHFRLCMGAERNSQVCRSLQFGRVHCFQFVCLTAAERTMAVTASVRRTVACCMWCVSGTFSRKKPIFFLLFNTEIKLNFLFPSVTKTTICCPFFLRNRGDLALRSCMAPSGQLPRLFFSKLGCVSPRDPRVAQCGSSCQLSCAKGKQNPLQVCFYFTEYEYISDVSYRLHKKVLQVLFFSNIAIFSLFVSDINEALTGASDPTSAYLFLASFCGQKVTSFVGKNFAIS